MIEMSDPGFVKFCQSQFSSPVVCRRAERHSLLGRVGNFRHYLQNFLLKKLWKVRSPAHKLGILAGRRKGRRYGVGIVDLPEIDNSIQASDCVLVGSDQLPSQFFKYRLEMTHHLIEFPLLAIFHLEGS